MSEEPHSGPVSTTEETYAATTSDDDIDAFLREEGVPVAAPLTGNDILSAVVTLGYTVAATSVRFITKMTLRRLDTVMCVEGELVKDAERHTTTNGPRREGCVGVVGWSRHLYREDASVRTFLRGGWAELGFVLATTVEEAATLLTLRAVFRRLNIAAPQLSRTGLGWAAVHVMAPMVVAGLLSWPLRAVRTAVMVNYLADTTVPPTAPPAAPAESKVPPPSATGGARTAPSSRVHRYGSAREAWGRVWQCRGLRSLLQNGLDVDMSSRVVSMALVWTVVQPVTRWFREVAVVRARAAAVDGSAHSGLYDPTSVAASSASPLLTRLGQYRGFNLAALLVVVGAVNTLQRPFVVLRQRMALLPQSDEEESTRRGCRYASGWECACQVVRREGMSALFAGLPLCLLTSTAVPLVITFAGFPTAPSFSGAAV